MIIFYNKKTLEILGVVEGRVHKDTKRFSMEFTSISKSEVGKYIVPFRIKYKEVEEPMTEMRVTDKRTMRVEQVVIGKKKVRKIVGMEPNVPFASLILDFESGKKRIYDYKVKLKKDEVVGFMLK